MCAELTSHAFLELYSVKREKKVLLLCLFLMMFLLNSLLNAFVSTKFFILIVYY